MSEAPYVMKPMPDIYMDQGKSYGPIDLTQFFYDNDTPYGDSLAYGVMSNGSVWVNMSKTGKVTLAAPINFWGTQIITFKATDSTDLIIDAPCKVIVRHINQAPQVRNQPPPLEINEDDSLTMDFSMVFWDPDGDPITLMPAGNIRIEVLAQPGDLNITFRPQPDLSGFMESIRLTAKDSANLGENFVVVKVTIIAVNDPPRITSFSPPGNVTLQETDALDFSVAASDPESFAAIDYTWYLDDEQTVSGATVWSYRTNYSSAGQHIVKVAISDGELVTEKLWNVTVRNVNREPAKVSILNPKPGEIIKEGTSIRFEGSAQDPDGEVLGYRWLEGLAEIGNGQNFSMELTVGMHKITLEVTDGLVAVKSPTVSITVKVNGRPTLVSIYPVDGKKYDKGTLVNFAVEAQDTDNDTLTYTWTENGKLLSNAPSFSLKNLTAGKHRVNIAVSDGTVVSESTVTFEITEPAVSGPNYLLYGGIIGAVAVVAVLSAVLLLGRRKKPAPAAPTSLKQPRVEW